MRSAATAFALLLLLAATPLMAQGHPVEWTLWGSMVNPQGSNDLGDFSIETDNGSRPAERTLSVSSEAVSMRTWVGSRRRSSAL